MKTELHFHKSICGKFTVHQKIIYIVLSAEAFVRNKFRNVRSKVFMAVMIMMMFFWV
jgi:hypothetical protein